MRGCWLFTLLLVSLGLHAIRFSDEAKRNCQQMDSVAGTVTIVFATDQAHFGIPVDSIASLWVSGPVADFCDTLPGYRLDLVSEDSCLYHTFRWEDLDKPGNSGQPEFVFFIIKKDSTGGNVYGDMMQQEKMDYGIYFPNGHRYTTLLLPCGADYLTKDVHVLASRLDTAIEIWGVDRFDLTNPVDQQHISNFRLTPGTKNLYRSFHPYYPSCPQYESEPYRLYWVGELGRQAGIRSDICLTGNMESYDGSWYRCGADSFQIVIPDYQRTLMDSGNICYVGSHTGSNPDVATCYYHSDEPTFAQYMGEVITFIADTLHPLPMQIHCAVGADRTGMVCALIASLCGADWEAICADYQATVNMKIRTYRHPNRLIYGIERMTGLRPDRCSGEQLRAGIRHHLVQTMGVVTDAQVDQMIVRLQQESPTGIEMVQPTHQVHKKYDLLGREVNAHYRGWCIDSDTRCPIISYVETPR